MPNGEHCFVVNEKIMRRLCDSGLIEKPTEIDPGKLLAAP